MFIANNHLREWWIMLIYFLKKSDRDTLDIEAEQKERDALYT